MVSEIKHGLSKLSEEKETNFNRIGSISLLALFVVPVAHHWTNHSVQEKELGITITDFYAIVPSVLFLFVLLVSKSAAVWFSKNKESFGTTQAAALLGIPLVILLFFLSLI